MYAVYWQFGVTELTSDFHDMVYVTVAKFIYVFQLIK